jgi:hypothetical protein
MLVHLKNAIRKKKLYFIINDSIKNKKKELLYFFLINNIFTGFSKFSYKKNTYLIIFLNYSFNFSGCMTKISFYSKRLSKEQYKIMDSRYLASNFVKNVQLAKKQKYESGLKKPKSIIKFR